MFQHTKICTGLLIAFGASAVGTAAAQDAAQPTQRVEITGSSIKRVDAETALPVQIVTREDISKLGVTNTEQLLSTISATSAVGGTTTAEGAGASTYGEATVSLRGLGANRTLVLVNGRRLPMYATDTNGGVDINSIPLAAVDRVEVLKDGASGLYGSDAVAGVVNFILRKDFNGVELSVYAGRPTTAGGGASTKGSIVAGFGDFETDHFNLMASLDVGKESAIYGRQRSYANHGWETGIYDYPATGSGGLYTPANANTALIGTTAEKSLGNPLAPDNCAANGSKYDANDGGCYFDSSPFVPLTPDVMRINGALNLRARLNSDNEFFIESFISHNTTVTTEQYSPYKNVFLITDSLFAAKGVDPDIIMNPTNPAYPLAYLQAYDTANGTHIAGTPVAVAYRATDGGARVHTDEATLYHLATGFKGTVSDFDYDATYSHNVSTVAETTQAGYQSQFALVSLLSGNDAFNPYAQYQTPALAAKIAATDYVGPMIASSLSTDAIDAKVSKDLYALPGGLLTFAAGVSFRKEQLNLRPSAAYMSGDIAGYGGQVLPLQASRDSHSVFAEIDAPILKSLDADVSVRNDHYPNASSTNPKLSLKFAPVSQIAFRGSVGTGFREPSLPELYDPQTLDTTTQFSNPYLSTPSHPVTGQYPDTIGGNPDLKPEKSKQFSLGLVLQPIKSVSATVDYFHIRVSNEVTTLAPELIVDKAQAGNPTYQALVACDGKALGSDCTDGNITNILATNLNAGSVTVSGFDVDVSWKGDKSSWGQFGANLNGTLMSSYVEVLPDGTVQQSVARTVDADGNTINAVGSSNGGVIMRWKHSLQGTWDYGPYGAVLTQNYQAGYYDSPRADADPLNPVPVHHHPFETWDLQGSYSGIKNLTLSLGAKNFLNAQPPKAINAGQYFQTGYDPTYYDPHGRFVYGSMTYKY